MPDTVIQVIRKNLGEGTFGGDGAPGSDGASIELRVSGGWVQWRQSDNDPTWANLFEVPSGETGEELIKTTTSLFVPTQIADTLLAADGLVSFDVSALTYKHYTIFYRARGTTSGAGIGATITLNGDTSEASNNYVNQRIIGFSNAANATELSTRLAFVIPGSTAPSGEFGRGRIEIEFADDAFLKGLHTVYGAKVAAADEYVGVSTLHWNHTTRINSIALTANGSNFLTGSEFQLIGWKNVAVVTDVTGTGVQGSPGANGLNGAPGVNGVCDCDDGDFIDDLPNSAQNRCGVAVAIVASLKATYQYAKLDPENWAELQALATTVTTTGLSASVAAGVAFALFGVGLTGVGLFGGVVAGAGALLAGILDLTNDNTDRFTPTREVAMQTSLYCVLSRRESTAFDADVIREWISFIADVGFPDADLDIILGILAWTPIAYWQGEAHVAQPKINPCSTAECDSRSTEFTYRFGGAIIDDAIMFVRPLASALMQLTTGTRTDNGIESDPGFGYTRNFNVRVTLGRIVPLTSIIASVVYNQTAAVTSPIVTITADGISKTGTITGITSGFLTVQWDGLASVDEFSISGQIATAGDFDEDAYLFLDLLQYCGDGFPSFGVGNISVYECVPAEETDEWEESWDFRTNDGGWLVDRSTSGVASGFYVPGAGWRQAAGGGRDDLIIFNPAILDGSHRILEIELRWSLIVQAGHTWQSYLGVNGVTAPHTVAGQARAVGEISHIYDFSGSTQNGDGHITVGFDPRSGEMQSGGLETLVYARIKGEGGGNPF